jgi:hypothetical protein
MESLKDAAERFTDAIGNIEDAIDTWLEDAEDADDADGREARKEAREEIDASIEEVGDAVRDLADIFGVLKPVKAAR